ncbi:MAG: hypothetical protein OEO19_18675 [Gammaproteobacteria bacterium]|nr:hypothetical protein [Gammaproteobacteria bacterium]
MKFITGTRISIKAICVLLFPLILTAAEPQVDESWLDDDSEWRAQQVNEGQLMFIDPIHDQSILHSDTHLWITKGSRQTGWVKMQQCYRHLDAVGRTDVVYAYRKMKNLQVTRAERIAQVRVGQHGVELEDVGKDAALCVQADVKVLQHLSDKTYVMQNGPYHRKFLDGYYPYHVSLTVHYSNNEMQLMRVEPEAQDGFYVTEKPGILSIDSWFEGELRIGFEFSKK